MDWQRGTRYRRQMQKLTAALLAIATSTSGCVATGMTKLPTPWNGTGEPDCNDDAGPYILGDVAGIVAGLAAASLGGLIVKDEDTGTGGDIAGTGMMIIGVGGAIGFAISALPGEEAASRCRRAKEHWEFSGGTREMSEDTQDALRAEFAHEQAAEDARAAAADAPPPGFFCTTTPADALAGKCGRGADACTTRQRQLVKDTGDATPCAPAASASCFDVTMASTGKTVESCHPTVGSCERQRGKLSEKPDAYRDVTACGDR